MYDKLMWEKGHYVYMLLCQNGSFYIGSAKEPAKRFALHQKGMGAKFTRANKPLKMVYLQEFPTWSEALKEEVRLKKLTHSQKLDLPPSSHNLINLNPNGEPT